jgi:hypothetical protein
MESAAVRSSGGRLLLAGSVRALVALSLEFGQPAMSPSHGMRQRDVAMARSSAMNGADDWDWSLRIFDHIDLQAADYVHSVRFYEAVLGPLGIGKLFEDDDSVCIANFNVVRARAATANLHLCFHARTKEQVDGFHRTGVAAGFRSDGASGHRDYGPGYYALSSTRTATTSRRSTATQGTSATAP